MAITVLTAPAKQTRASFSDQPIQQAAKNLYCTVTCNAHWDRAEMIASKPTPGVPCSSPVLARAGQFVFREFQPVNPHRDPFLASFSIAILKWLMLFAISFGASTPLHAQGRPDAASLPQSPIAAAQQAVLPSATRRNNQLQTKPSAPDKRCSWVPATCSMSASSTRRSYRANSARIISAKSLYR